MSVVFLANDITFAQVAIAASADELVLLALGHATEHADDLASGRFAVCWRDDGRTLELISSQLVNLNPCRLVGREGHDRKLPQSHFP